jgi:hypothetical protein
MAEDEDQFVSRRGEQLNTDIDFRLMELFIESHDVDEWTPEVLHAFLRAAYGRGYVDALEEEKRGERGKLCRDHDYRIP